MRRSEPLRRVATVILLLAGLAYLVYKAPYLSLDIPDELKAFIVSPGVALLIAASFVGFVDARRRLGGILVVLGSVALLSARSKEIPRPGWTFYGPYPAAEAESVFSHLGHQPHDAKWVAVTLLIPIGFALVARRRRVPIALLSLAGLAVLLPPSRVLLEIAMSGHDGMPRRYHYYYFSPYATATATWLDVTIPATLAVAGIAWMLVRGRSA